MKKPVRRNDGFMLIEVLVSIVLFSVGVLGLLAVHAHSAQTSGDSEDRMRAAVLASQGASLLWAQDSTTSLPSDYTTWQTAVANTTDGGLPNGVGTITPGTPAYVTITWSTPWKGTAQTSQYKTIVQIP